MRKIIVPVSINGKQRRFMLDTGAPLSVSPVLARELGLDLKARYPVTDQSGKVDSMSFVKVRAIQLGDIVFNDIPAVVAADVGMQCLQLDGVIGSNILRNSIVHFSPLDSTITITDDPSKLNLDRLKKKQVSDLIPIANDASNPYIKILLRGKQTASEEVLFDTGMDGFYDICLRNFQLFAGHGIFNVLAQGYGSYSAGLHGVATDTTQFKLLIPKLEINGAVFKNVIAKTTSGNDSRIGAGLLNYGAVTVDYKNGKLYFEPFPKHKEDLYEKQFPFNPVVKEDKLVVGIIWKKEMLDKINVGDQIISVNDYNCENLTLCEILATQFPVEKDRLLLTIKNQEGNIEKVEMLAE